MIRKLTGIFLLVFLFTTNASAVDVGVGLKAGTLGAGVDITVALTKTINARIGITSIDIEGEDETIEVGDSGSTGDLDAELDFDFGATALLIDWYVFDGTFHLTGGLVRNDSKVSFSGALQDGIVVDGEVLDPSDINGNISGDISLGESFQPYIGVGWGRKAGIEPGLSVSVELGVALLDPSANLNANVDVSGSNSLTQAELDDLVKGIEDDATDDLSALEAWPVLSIGVNYAF